MWFFSSVAKLSLLCSERPGGAAKDWTIPPYSWKTHDGMYIKSWPPLGPKTVLKRNVKVLWSLTWLKLQVIFQKVHRPWLLVTRFVREYTHTCVQPRSSNTREYAYHRNPSRFEEVTTTSIFDIFSLKLAELLSDIPIRSFITKAGPAVLIRIHINTVSVSDTPYCLSEPYLPYSTVEKYDLYF